MSSDHNGGARFITPRITRTEDLPQYQSARPRGDERPDFRGGPPSEAKIAQDNAFLNHHVARAAAARCGPRKFISQETVNAMVLAKPPHAEIDQAALQELARLRAALEAQEAITASQNRVIDAQAAALTELRSRVDDLAGNSFAAGEMS